MFWEDLAAESRGKLGYNIRMEPRRSAPWDDEFLDSFWREPLPDPLLALLVRDMCMVADEQGRAPLEILATRFRNFFRKRREEGRTPLDAARATHLGVEAADLADQTVPWWRERVVEIACETELFHCETESVLWVPGLWSNWSAGFKKALRNIAEAKLIAYFEKANAGT